MKTKILPMGWALRFMVVSQIESTASENNRMKLIKVFVAWLPRACEVSFIQLFIFLKIEKSGVSEILGYTASKLSISFLLDGCLKYWKIGAVIGGACPSEQRILVAYENRVSTWCIWTTEFLFLPMGRHQLTKWS